MRLVLGLVAGLLAASSLPGCGGEPARGPVAAAVVEPHWQDVFETTPELLVALHPSALRDDKVYGPLFRRVIDAARERSRFASATRVLDVIGDADSVVVGVRPPTRGGDDPPSELVVVLRGVRASVDPGRVVDSEGKALWAPGPNGPVRELVRETDEHGHPIDASLFELEGQTWVIASGDARTRAREVFAHPLGRPALTLDANALATVRIDGPSLVKRIRALQPLGGLAAIGRKLQSLTALLPPGSEGKVELVLSYAEEDAAAFAEVAARQVVDAIGRKKPERLDWLAGATVERPDKRVVLTVPLPSSLVDSLLRAGSAPIDLEPEPAALPPPREPREPRDRASP